MKVLAAALAFFFAAILSADIAEAKMSHAALAVVWKQGKKFHGLGYGATAAQAKKAALAKCTNGRCRVVQSYGPGQCVHLVIGAYQIFWNEGPEDGKDVMRYCRQRDPECRKLVSHCLPR